MDEQVMTTTETACIWQMPPQTLTISQQVVHVWRASLDVPAARLLHLQKTLSEDEVKRAQRFVAQHDHDRFVAARGILRDIISRYVQREPQNLCFDYGERGKPELASAYGLMPLRFNLAHSHDLALYAIAYQRETGIDVERIRPDVACEQIAERFFSPREYADLCRFPQQTRHRAFFRCWSLKEAYIKAQGIGLWQSLDDFSVLVDPAGKVTLTITDNATEATRWSLQELFPDPAYAAALAVAGHDWQLSCWQWSSEDDQTNC
jgi:4'-phosphopantetheinyl transferase